MSGSKRRVPEPPCLDVSNACLWCGAQRIPLSKKELAVLHTLTQHAGQMVSKDVLLDAGWPQTFVTEGVLKVCIHRLRRALDDTARQPRVIETVHGRGYRLIGEIRLVSASTTPFETFTPGYPVLPPPWLVGREDVLIQMHGWLESARQGTRQIGFVTGEVGIGKTTVVDAFLDQVAPDDGIDILRGQCVEHYGSGEAYLPLLEAWQQGCRGPHAGRYLNVLRRHAPTWLLHLPGLLDDSEYETLQRRHAATGHDRMLREMAEALEALAGDKCLVLVLEDLHWSDVATLDLVTLLAQRRQPACILLLGTFRPEDLLVSEHPLQAVLPTLRRQPQVQQLALIPLTVGGVTAYLAARFPVSTLPVTLASLLHQRSEGNPLFLVTLVEHLVAQGVLEQTGGSWTLQSDEAALQEDVPDTLQQVIMQRRALCSPDEQRMLAVASVAGISFSAASVAAGLAAEVIETEGRCAEIAQRGLFLRKEREAVWADGTVATQYGFRHALYQQVLYEQVPAAQRVQLHRRIAEREEQGYGEQASDIAPRLALHFERGHDYPRAVIYYCHAANNALQRYAYVEAVGHCRHGLALLATLPETPEHQQQERDLLLSLAPALMTTKGRTDPEVEQVYLRARHVCSYLGDTSRLFFILRGLASHYAMGGNLARYTELGRQLLDRALKQDDPVKLILAYSAVGTALQYRGDFVASREYLEHGMDLYSQHRHRAPAVRYGTERDRGVACFTYGALTLWFLGYPDRARTYMQQAPTLAQELAHPYTLAHTMNYANTLDLLCGNDGDIAVRAEAVSALSTAHNIPEYAGTATYWRGRVLIGQGLHAEGLAQVQRGVEASRSGGILLTLPGRLLFLANFYGQVGQPKAGLSVLHEALAIIDKTGEGWREAELHRTKGELLLSAGCVRNAESTPEACFQKAIEITRRQQARSWELRAATSLARLWQRQGKCQEAQQLLSEIYNWFTEGFDTADLKDAKALLDALGVYGGMGVAVYNRV